MELNTLALVRAFHVIGVVLWIGGVAMVTTVLLPATRRLKSTEEQVAFFEKIESRFAWQARFTTPACRPDRLSHAGGDARLGALRHGTVLVAARDDRNLGDLHSDAVRA